MEFEMVEPRQSLELGVFRLLLINELAAGLHDFDQPGCYKNGEGGAVDAVSIDYNSLNSQ